MGLLDAFRKDEVTGTKALVCALGAQHEELRRNDERIYRRFYSSTTSQSVTSTSDLKALLKQGFDIVHLLCNIDAQGDVADDAGGKISGTDLLHTCLDSGTKLFWIASDNFADPYNTGFKPKGMKMNVILTERRLGPNCSLFIDSLLTKLSSGESFSKAWNVVSRPEGKSVQPDVPHVITSLGRGAVILRP